MLSIFCYNNTVLTKVIIISYIIANSKDVEHDDGFIGMATKKTRKQDEEEKEEEMERQKGQVNPFFYT